MFSLNNKISVRQLQILIILDVFGTGIIILPRTVAEYSAQDGWVVIIISTIIALFYAYIFTSLLAMFPQKSFVDILATIIGKPIGYFLAFIYAIKLIISASLELRNFAEITRQTMLYTTPFWCVMGGMLLIAGFVATKGYEARARLGEILIVIMLIPLIIVFLIAAIDVDYTNILPILKTPKENLFIGGYFAAFSFAGIEICMIVNPYINNYKKVRSAILQVVLFLGGFYLIITIVAIARFGPQSITKQMWPVLAMMDTINIPGSFIERQEALIMTFWIISVFAVVSAGLFGSSLIFKDIIKKGTHTMFIIVCIPIIFLIAYIPKDIFSVSKDLKLINSTLGIAYMFFVPFSLLILAKIRKLGGNLNAKKN